MYAYLYLHKDLRYKDLTRNISFAFQIEVIPAVVVIISNVVFLVAFPVAALLWYILSVNLMSSPLLYDGLFYTIGVLSSLFLRHLIEIK